MPHINLYTNPKAAETILKLIRIAQKAHTINPSPVEIKLQLAGMDSEMLQELATNFEELLKAPKPETHKDYWQCKCTSKNIHRRDGLVYCEQCDTHSLEAPDANMDEVNAMIQEALTK